MNDATISALVHAAQSHGWATGKMALPFLEFAMKQLGWTPVSIRKDDEDVAELRPSHPDKANIRSLSAIYGLKEFPLHTDGAHLPKPPDLLILHAAQPNSVPTLLWSIRNKVTNPRYPLMQFPSELSGGLFLATTGSDSFLSSAYERGRYRYDPGCMVPCDERARKSVEYFNGLHADAYHHNWNESDQVLVINNRTTLHGRAEATDEPERLLTRIAYRMAEQQ